MNNAFNFDSFKERTENDLKLDFGIYWTKGKFHYATVITL